MSKCRLHNVRFYSPDIYAIHCLAYCDELKKLALSRANNSVEIWSVPDEKLYREKVIYPTSAVSIEALVWCQKRLFSVGLTGVITEYDLVNLNIKNCVASSFGACWCMAANSAGTHLAIGSEEGYLCTFMVTPNTLDYEKTFDKQEGRVWCLAWHVSGNYIVTGTQGSIRLWSVSTGHAIQNMNVGQVKKKGFIVWCVAITEDLIIISGDSLGRVSFWNGKLGVLLFSIRSSDTAIVCMAHDKTNDRIWVSGIDPRLVEYVRVSSAAVSKQWVKGIVHHYHTHDVRAIVIAKNLLISGGVDTTLRINKYPPKVTVECSSFYCDQLVQIASMANCLLLQYFNSIELWQLGSSKDNSDTDKTVLTLSSIQLKLLELRTKEGEYVVCSAVSSDACWLAYASTTSLRLFKVMLEGKDAEQPTVSVFRVCILPEECRPSRCLAFTTSGSRLICLLPSGDLQVIGVDPALPTLLHQFEAKTYYKFGCHLLCVSNDGHFAAVGSHCGQVCVYDLEKFTIHCYLPKRHVQPTAIAFTPSCKQLAAVYQDRKIFVFDVLQLYYLPGSGVVCSGLLPLLGISFDPKSESTIILHDGKTVYAIKDLNKGTLMILREYKHLVNFSSVKDDFFVAVEVPLMKILQKLPNQLKKKRFAV